MNHLITRITLSLVAIAIIIAPFAVPKVAIAAAATQQSIDLSVRPVQGPSAAQKLKERADVSWPWYITRGAGIVAVILLALLILSGIGLVTGYTFRFFEPLTAWATHKALGLAFGIAVLIHVGALLFDKFVPFSIAAVLFPFISNYRPVTLYGHHLGSLYVALGVFAFYGVAIIIISSLLWIDKKPRRWKLLHLLSYLTAICVFFHGLYLGTDLTHGTFRTIWIVIGIATGIAMLYRLKRARSV